MRGAQSVTLQPHHILSLPRAFFVLKKNNILRFGTHSNLHRMLPLSRKMTRQHHQMLHLSRKTTFTKSDTWTSPNTAPATSSNAAPVTQNDFHEKWHLNFTEYCACHETWHANIIKCWSSSHMKRHSQCAEQQWKIQHFALQLSFQISPNAAPATKSDTWTSPSAAPATQNHSHDWSWSLTKRYLQCAG